ncbi:MAG: hypothetical protein Q9195_003646 [Heterodermia aff. obscurata]
MALEAFGTASNAAGLVSLGLTVCHGLLKYYDSWKEAESDMKKMYTSIETLARIFTALKSTLSSPYLKLDLVHRVEANIAACEDGIGCLDKKLKKINMTPCNKSGNWDAKMKFKLQRALYPFKESTLVKLKEVSNGMLDNLRLALQVLQVDTTAMSLQVLSDQGDGIRDISTGLQNLQTEVSHTSAGIAKLTSIQKGLESHSMGSENVRLIRRVPGMDSRYRRFEDVQTDVSFQLAGANIALQVWPPGESVKQFSRFIYGYYNDSRKQTIHNLIGVIIQQLATQDDSCMDELQQCYESHRKARTHPSLMEYCKILRSIAGHFSSVFVVIDALDEYDEETRNILLEKLGALRPDLSLLITTRHAAFSSSWSQAETRLNIVANEADIRGYLGERLRQCNVLRPHIAKDGNLHEEIVSSIVQKAKGMFLLARLQLDSLMAKPTLRKIRQALHTLPEELEAMYGQALERIRAQDPEYASLGLKIICWVHHAARPLSLQEIRQALAVEVDDKTFDNDGLPDDGLLESACAGLITIQEHCTVGLVHYTAQEYLSRNSSVLFPGTDAMIANICLTYLCFEDFTSGPCNSDNDLQVRLDQYPLLRYAAQYWAQHVRATNDSILDEKILYFLARKPNVESSIQAMLATKSRIKNWSLEYTKGLDGLCLASMHGLQPICVKFLEQGADVNSTDHCGYTSLHYAAIHNYGSIVALLLDCDASLDLRTIYHGRTALHWAAWHGHESVVRQLLSRGADTAARDQRGWTALHLAASGGHLQILRTLLEANNNVNAVDGYGATALYRAAEEGHEEATQLLLENFAELDIRNDYQQTALHRAADVGHLAVTRLLLEHGANYNLKDFYGWTPLYRASDHGHDDVADFLAEFAQRKQA